MSDDMHTDDVAVDETEVIDEEEIAQHIAANEARNEAILRPTYDAVKPEELVSVFFDHFIVFVAFFSVFRAII